MRNGSLQARILHEIETLSKPAFRLKDFLMYDYDQVGRVLRKLIIDNKVERIGRGLYRILPGHQPKLSHPRTWSRPSGVSDELFIASVLANPSFEDLTRLCLSFGVHRIHKTLSSCKQHIPLAICAETTRMIANVERGIADAYRQIA